MLRRDVILAAVLIPLGLVIGSCAPIHVSSHVEPSANFASYHSFAWGPADALPTGDPRLDNNPFFHDYLQGAVERRMQEHGIPLAGNAADADLLLHYHAAVTQRFDVSPSNQTSSGVYAEPQVLDYDESTIVLDMIDAKTMRLVWRGWAQESLQSVVDNQERLKKHIEDSVALMLKQLPL